MWTVLKEPYTQRPVLALCIFKSHVMPLISASLLQEGTPPLEERMHSEDPAGWDS